MGKDTVETTGPEGPTVPARRGWLEHKQQEEQPIQRGTVTANRVVQCHSGQMGRGEARVVVVRQGPR